MTLRPLVIWLLKKLEVKYWGANFESRLPPQFIITKHAKERIMQRMDLKMKDVPSVVILAWQKGKKPPTEFNKDKAVKPEAGLIFCREFRYKFYKGYIFVFGLKWNRQLKETQKYLLTIYYGNMYDDEIPPPTYDRTWVL